MIYGFEYSTDCRDNNVSVRKFRTEAAARRWLNEYAGQARYAYDDLARPHVPPSRSNYHKLGRVAYTMPPHWRPPSAKQIRAETDKWRGSSYRPSRNSVLMNACYAAGEELQ